MACTHIIQTANAKISLLKQEIPIYTAFSGKVESVAGSLDNYATFLSNLGSQLKEVRVTGYPYDNGKCALSAGKVGTLASTIRGMKDVCKQAIEEINQEIDEQIQIKKSDNMCDWCVNNTKKTKNINVLQ